MRTVLPWLSRTSTGTPLENGGGWGRSGFPIMKHAIGYFASPLIIPEAHYPREALKDLLGRQAYPDVKSLCSRLHMVKKRKVFARSRERRVSLE